MSPLHMPKLFPPLFFSQREERRNDAYDISIEGCGEKEEEKPKQIYQRRECSSTFILPSINIQVCLTFLGPIRLLRIKYMAPSVGLMVHTSASVKMSGNDDGVATTPPGLGQSF